MDADAWPAEGEAYTGPFRSWSMNARNHGDLLLPKREGVPEELQRWVEGLAIAQHGGNREVALLMLTIPREDLGGEILADMMKCRDGAKKAGEIIAWYDKPDGGMGG